MLDPNAILMPLFAMFTLSLIVLLRLAYLRNKAVMSKKVKMSYYEAFQGESGETSEMVATARNYVNLYEAPAFFYLVVILYYVTAGVDHYALAMAWGYVAFRFIHTLIHIGANNVRQRFVAFAVSQIFLLILWVKLGVQLYW